MTSTSYKTAGKIAASGKYNHAAFEEAYPNVHAAHSPFAGIHCPLNADAEEMHGHSQSRWIEMRTGYFADVYTMREGTGTSTVVGATRPIKPIHLYMKKRHPDFYKLHLGRAQMRADGTFSPKLLDHLTNAFNSGVHFDDWTELPIPLPRPRPSHVGKRAFPTIDVMWHRRSYVVNLGRLAWALHHGHWPDPDDIIVPAYYHPLSHYYDPVWWQSNIHPDNLTVRKACPDAANAADFYLPRSRQGNDKYEDEIDAMRREADPRFQELLLPDYKRPVLWPRYDT